ncbi:MAG: YafY family protein [Pseudomonadota bacterium]
MSRADRLLRLAQALRRLPKPVTAEVLAHAMDVSPRTVYRDIEALRASGAVIDGTAGYGYVLVEDSALPPLRFEDDEIEALVVGLKDVMSRGDPALARAAENALAKLRASLPEAAANRADHAVHGTVRFWPRPEAGVDPAMLRDAAWEERALTICYRDGAGAETERRVWPLALLFLDSTDFLVAWCHLRNDFRTFRLDRISRAVRMDESFRPRRVGLLRQYKDTVARSD